MKKLSSHKKAVSFVLALCLLVMTATVGTGKATVYAGTHEVSQISAESHVWSYAAGSAVYTVNIDIMVKNIAYDKKVTVHGKNALTGEWNDFNASYVRQINDEYELWTCKAVSYSFDYEYAIKYEVAGQTYWDNNNGKNYTTRPAHYY